MSLNLCVCVCVCVCMCVCVPLHRVCCKMQVGRNDPKVVVTLSPLYQVCVGGGGKAELEGGVAVIRRHYQY